MYKLCILYEMSRVCQEFSLIWNGHYICNLVVDHFLTEKPVGFPEVQWLEGSGGCSYSSKFALPETYPERTLAMDMVDLWKMMFHLMLLLEPFPMVVDVDAQGIWGIWRWKIMEEPACFTKIVSLIWRFPENCGGSPKSSGWWFGCHFLFSHILGINIPIDFHLFQRDGPTTNQSSIRNHLNRMQDDVPLYHPLRIPQFPVYLLSAC